MGHLVGIAHLLDGAGAVAAADDRDARAFRHRRGDGLGALGKFREFKDAHGAVPDNGSGVLHGLGEELLRLRPDVQTLPAGRDGVRGDDLAPGVGGEPVGHDDVHRQQQLHAGLLRLGEHVLAVVDLLGVEQGIAGLVALGLEERERHAAADDQRIGLLEQVLDHGQLVGDLRAAEHGHERALGIVDRAAERGQLLLHEEAAVRGQIVRDAGGGGVGAVHRAERVGNVHVRHGGKLFGKFGVVLLLARIKARVLQQQHLARPERGGLGLGVGADGILGKLDRFSEQLGKADGDAAERQVGLGVGVLFGLAEMGADDQRGAVVEQVLDRGQSGADALVVGDLVGRLVQRHVEVHAQQHFLAGKAHVADALLFVIHILDLLIIYFPFRTHCSTQIPILQVKSVNFCPFPPEKSTFNQTKCFVAMHALLV